LDLNQGKVDKKGGKVKRFTNNRKIS